MLQNILRADAAIISNKLKLLLSHQMEPIVTPPALDFIYADPSERRNVCAD